MILLGVLYGLENRYTYYLQQNVNLQSSFTTNHAINADILFLGNCNPSAILCPEVIDSITHLRSYNLAETDADFAENYLALHLYLQNNPPPKFLFIYLAPESFDPNYNRFNVTRYAHFLSDSIVNQTIGEMDSDYYRWTFLPFMRYGYYNEQVHFKALQGFKHSRNTDIQPYFKDGFEVGISHQFYKPSYPNNYAFGSSRQRLAYFFQIIRLAKEHHIQIIGFESPFWLETDQNLPNLATRRAEIQNLLRIDSLPFLDLSSSKGYTKSDFSSTITLTGTKSLVFSRNFADTILSRFIQQSQIHEHP